MKNEFFEFIIEVKIHSNRCASRNIICNVVHDERAMEVCCGSDVQRE